MDVWEFRKVRCKFIIIIIYENEIDWVRLLFDIFLEGYYVEIWIFIDWFD